ncbi:hypothetical protein Q7689_09865, partial [Nocardiopsis tropica]|nr:hypothetical protein [Nocardiopsis tropica]
DDTVVNGWPALSFRRPWDNEWHTIRTLRPDQVRAELLALEEIERTHPGWYVGFLHRTTPVEHLDGLWAQHPTESLVVHAETPPELKKRIRAARSQHGL